MTNIRASSESNVIYPIVEYEPPTVTVHKHNDFGSWIVVDLSSEELSSLSSQEPGYFSRLASYVSQSLESAGSTAFRGVVYAVHFGKELSARAVVYASATLSNNEENIRSTLLAAAQMANGVAQLAAGQGRHALAALGHASMQAGETIVDSAKRHGPYVGNALLSKTIQAAHSATRFAADQGPVVIEAIGVFGNMSVQATGTFVDVARHYGPEMIGCAQNMLSLATIKLEAVSCNFPLPRSIRSLHDSNNALIEMIPLAGKPQSASVEVIADEDNEIEDPQPVKAVSEDVDPLLGRIPLTRSPNSPRDMAIASQPQILNADTQAEHLDAPEEKPNMPPAAESAPEPKSLGNRFFTSIGDGLAAIFNGARTVVSTIAHAFLYVVTFKWLRGH